VNTEWMVRGTENKWDFDNAIVPSRGGWPRECLASVANRVRFRGKTDIASTSQNVRLWLKRK
jgi:hypothetical protein